MLVQPDTFTCLRYSQALVIYTHCFIFNFHKYRTKVRIKYEPDNSIIVFMVRTVGKPSINVRD